MHASEPDNAAEPSTPPPGGLSAVQERAIIALLSQPSIAKAAESVGVHECTIRRWMKDPAFRKAYRDARAETHSQAMALVLRYEALAVNTLAKVMSDPSAPHSAKVSAAGLLMKQGHDVIELEDVAGRVEALEADLKERKA